MRSGSETGELKDRLLEAMNAEVLDVKDALTRRMSADDYQYNCGFVHGLDRAAQLLLEIYKELPNDEE